MNRIASASKFNTYVMYSTFIEVHLHGQMISHFEIDSYYNDLKQGETIFTLKDEYFSMSFLHPDPLYTIKKKKDLPSLKRLVQVDRGNRTKCVWIIHIKFQLVCIIHNLFAFLEIAGYFL